MKNNLFNLNNNKIIIILLLLLLLFLIFDKNLIEANSNKDEDKCKFDNKDYEKSAKSNEDKMKKEADSISSKDDETNANIQALSG